MSAVTETEESNGLSPGHVFGPVSQELLHHSEALNLLKSYGAAPLLSDFLPVRPDHKQVVLFNNCEKLPEHLVASRSDLDVTRCSKTTALVSWLTETKALNPASLVSYYGRPENISVLEGLLDRIFDANKDNFVELLRSYVAATGCMSVVVEGPSDQDLDGSSSKVWTTIDTDSLVYYLFSFFSKYYINHHDSCRHNPDITPDTWEQVAELCQRLLDLSMALHKSTQCMGTLQDFFVIVRSFAKRNFVLFSPRSLTNMFNTLKSNGPFLRPRISREIPAYLFANITRTARVTIAFNDVNDISLPRIIILTKDAMYTFEDKDEESVSDGSHGNEVRRERRGVGCYLECVPLKYLRVQESEMDHTLIEISPHREGTLIPCFNVENNNDDSDTISMDFFEGLYLRAVRPENHEPLMAELENKIWGAKKQHSVSSALL